MGDGGSIQNLKDITKTFKGVVSFTTTDFWPKQDDLQNRRDYSLAQQGAKRRLLIRVSIVVHFLTFQLRFSMWIVI